jgi:hypothetical protein
MPNFKNIPPAVKASLDAWGESAQPPGGFVMAVLENDLQGAFALADDASLANMHAIVLYVYNELVSACWGNKEKIEAWSRKHAALKRSHALS